MELDVLLLPDLVGKEPLVPWRSEMLVDVEELLRVELPDMTEPFASAKVVAGMIAEPFCVLVVE